MKVTLSVIKADIGGYVGHSSSHPKILEAAKESLSDAKEKDIIIDYYVTRCGDDLELIMTHDRGTEDDEIHGLAWDTFVKCTELAKELKLYGAGQDLLSDAFSGNIRGMGPGFAEMEFEERRSEHKITPDSAKKFVKMILDLGHESVIEHEKVTVRVICDRGISHEIVRHRIASYTQESTRFCNYSKGRFGNEITVIKPCFWDDGSKEYKIWRDAMENAERAYMELIKLGAKPEEARSVLPNSLKTEIVITMNLREWRHFFKLRTSKRAHPQMREVATSLLQAFKERIPVIFDDIGD